MRGVHAKGMSQSLHCVTQHAGAHASGARAQGVGRKLNTPLLFPGRLDARPFLSATVLRHRFAGRPRAAAAAELGPPPEEGAGAAYELYAVVCHRGSLQARPVSAWFQGLEVALLVRPDQVRQGLMQRSMVTAFLCCLPDRPENGVRMPSTTWIRPSGTVEKKIPVLAKRCRACCMHAMAAWVPCPGLSCAQQIVLCCT